MPALKAIAKLAPVVISESVVGNGNQVDQVLITADRKYTVEFVAQSQIVAGTDPGAVTLDLVKAAPGVVIGSGVSVLGSTFNLKSAVNTPVLKTRANGGVLSTSIATLNVGDRLALNYTGVVTALDGVSVTVVLRPVIGTSGR